MKNVKLFLLVTLSVSLIFLTIFLVPRTYDVEPFIERNNTQFWELKSGSKLGFIKFETLDSFNKNPIIYLHGGPGGRIKDNVIEALLPLRNKGHDLYFYDQVGSGHSNRLKDIGQYSVDRHRNDLKEIISIIGYEKVLLIGHSWGACLAINYLQTHEEDIEKIILIGPGPILPINRSLIYEIAPDSLSLLEPEYSNREGNEKAYTWRSKIILKWAKLFNSKLAKDQEVDDFYTFLNQELSKSTDCNIGETQKYEGGGGYYSHIMTMKSLKYVEDDRSKLKKMNTPILILRGQCDNQKWGFTNEYLDLFVNSELNIVDGVGHNLLTKKSKLCNNLISDFLLKE